MVRKQPIRQLTAAVLFLLLVCGCSAHHHTVGAGATGDDSVSARQWYILWGLVPLNDVDTTELAGGSVNYEIDTEQGFLDIVINIFTGIVTVNSRTVTVTR